MDGKTFIWNRRSMNKGKISIGVLGFGRMGRKHVRELVKNDLWDVACICDIDPGRAASAAELAPGAKFTTNEDDIFLNPDIDCVGLFALADSRASRIEVRQTCDMRETLGLQERRRVEGGGDGETLRQRMHGEPLSA